ncbi:MULTISPECIES: Ycf51 family protein [unclassified Coleofasciculus]|uniref:Ycf51 family protein n=1 Tax=unclassified Coleofasciculus TaxID=2692782 RepID=UPI0018810750|nr:MULTISPECIES: Ycf51 family protein [unclassified Coleofasciculus]MBE9125516.1 Ycf51 family protein [Coleofasciculus sp. LEGE 07081]MBE9148620.1 Ycf51 family protein [Coleofasciculus sp. LEGE 07092]
MPTTANFLTYTQWVGILTLVCGLLSLLGFILKWGIRFRLVGITGFMAVITGGLFALSLVPLTRTAIPGAIHSSLVYDNGGNQTVIAVPPTITESELEATMRQAAGDFFSFGRLGGSDNKMTIRVRTVIHPEPGVSKPLFLGQVKRSLARRDDEQMAIDIYPESFAQLPDSST